MHQHLNPLFIYTALQSSHLKLIAEQYDKCQEVVTQYAEFLRHGLAPADYAKILPPIQVRGSLGRVS